MAQIMVQLQNGQQGTMDDSQFDPNTMKQLGSASGIQNQASQIPTQAPVTPAGNGNISLDTLKQNALQLMSQYPTETSKIATQYGDYAKILTPTKDEQLMSQLQKDVAAGGKYSDLGPQYTKAGLAEPLVRAAYNAGPVAQQYGPATETPADLAALASGKPTAAQVASQKNSDAYNMAKGNIQTILDSFSALPGYDKGSPVNATNIPLAGSLTQGATYNKQAAGLAAQLGPLAGAGTGTGLRINNYELARWQALLPTVNNLPAQNAKNVALLDSELKNKFGQGLDPQYLKQFGVTPSKTTPTPATNNGDQTGNPITDALNGNPVTKFLLSKATNVAQDIGTGINAQTAAPGMQKNELAAQALEVAASQTKNPQQIKSLLAQANSLRTGTSQEAGGISRAFSPDVTQNPITRGAEAGNQIAGAAGLVEMATKIPAILNGVQDAGSALLSRLTGTGAATAAPEAAATTTAAQPNIIQSFLQNLTKSGVNSKITNAAATGGDINYEDIANAARNQVANKGSVVKAELEKLISENTPMPAGGAPPGNAAATLTSPQALELRQGLGSRLPANFFENGLSKILGGNNASERNIAIDALRRSASDALKTAAPGTIGPSKLYSLYAQHGDPAELLTRAGIGLGANRLGKVVPGIGNPTLDALPLLAKLFGGL